ncbi:MAG: hypothetical protein QOF30_1759, partial [Acidimicrobiaceae bacterium]|nr:hypothetical protein [Acidimicrobiaceae bacterium]
RGAHFTSERRQITVVLYWTTEPTVYADSMQNVWDKGSRGHTSRIVSGVNGLVRSTLRHQAAWVDKPSD